ncbi:hypothetical protein B0H19DRAFT_1074295 [Mycena capillaripes]|nr:hypothetical protein B0H19DRAFT_1074295 [Mycena capillaripes]
MNRFVTTGSRLKKEERERIACAVPNSKQQGPYYIHICVICMLRMYLITVILNSPIYHFPKWRSQGQVQGNSGIYIRLPMCTPRCRRTIGKLILRLSTSRCEAGARATHFPLPQGPSVPHTNTGLPAVPQPGRAPGLDLLRANNSTTVPYNLRHGQPCMRTDILRGHDSPTMIHSSKRKATPSSASGPSGRGSLPPERRWQILQWEPVTIFSPLKHTPQSQLPFLLLSVELKPSIGLPKRLPPCASSVLRSREIMTKQEERGIKGDGNRQSTAPANFFVEGTAQGKANTG